MHLKAKEELWNLKYFTMQKYNLQETKILQDIITLELISKVSTQAKISSFTNPHHIKIDLLLRGQNPLKLLYSIMNLNTISLTKCSPSLAPG
jgi:hypothetical protein